MLRLVMEIDGEVRREGEGECVCERESASMQRTCSGELTTWSDWKPHLLEASNSSTAHYLYIVTELLHNI